MLAIEFRLSVLATNHVTGTTLFARYFEMILLFTYIINLIITSHRSDFRAEILCVYLCVCVCLHDTYVCVHW